ncbi:hypothetical protein HDU87_003138 [Geranomyces variabilis]|uniref:Uncharacterized protein n=1 Tax=Geranomyces variabilis TaxID=109894 RepID=A0AAD5TKK0_9FUNG|nr:hypothetical protein HDU87_003138 [Geranomyces variabilis]
MSKPSTPKTRSPLSTKFNPADALFYTGVTHCVLPLLLPTLRNPLVSLIRGGYFNGLSKVVSAPTALLFAQSNAFWFTVTGVAFTIAGRALQCYVRDVGALSPRPVRIPRGIAWALIALGAVGAAATPVSGFVLLLAQGSWMLTWESKPVGKDA